MKIIKGDNELYSKLVNIFNELLTDEEMDN